MPQQYTAHLMMIRPACFQFNMETAASNAFQHAIEGLSKEIFTLLSLISFILPTSL